MTRKRDLRKVIKIFFASPSDVDKERKSFRSIIQEANRLMANPMGVQLDALGWEDTLPGKGRPQGLINADLKNADLIVFVFWKRWGTPTGSFSSGTEEEFAVARQLAAEGSSDVWLYFKTVPASEKAVPDDQLRRVLEFRTAIRDERSLLFFDFGKYRNWAALGESCGLLRPFAVCSFDESGHGGRPGRPIPIKPGEAYAVPAHRPATAARGARCAARRCSSAHRVLRSLRPLCYQEDSVRRSPANCS